MKQLTKGERGVVSIELALVLVLFVVPIALAVAKFAPPAVAWVQSTSKRLDENTAAQKRTAELLEQLLQKQGQSSGPSPEGSPTPNPPGCDPTPGSADPC